MKLQIIGFDGSSGIGKKSGKAYAMAQIHTLAELAPPFSEDGISKGFMGTSYSCSLPLVEKIKDLRCPFFAEVDIRPVMRFGQREELVFDISPVTTTKTTA